MHKHILLIIIVLSLSFVCSTICWWNVRYTVQKNNCTINDLVDDPAAVEAAVQKMGPYKSYLITSDGKLLVKVDNKWLRIHYEKEG